MATQPISAEVFVDLALFVEDLLGSERLDVLLAKYERALSHGNDKFVPHRLVSNYRATRDSIETMKSRRPGGSFVEMMELSLFRDLVGIFETDPAWSQLKSDVYSTGGFVHMVILLMFVHIQRAEKKSIDLIVPESDGQKIGDAVMYTPLRDRIDIEIKCPELLWAPGHISDAEADKVIENCWRRSRRQIRQGVSILVIGGLYIPKDAMKKLGQAAERQLARRKNKHVGFIHLLSMTILVDSPKFAPGDQNFAIGPKTKMNHQIVQHPIANPHYDGIVEWLERKDPTPGFTPSAPTTEFTINRDKRPK